jgi:predicted PurR-regulated permease PerM
MSVGRIGWALVLTVGVSSFIFSWLFSKQVESTVNDIEREHEDLKKQLHHVQDRLESDKDLEQEQLENIDEILLHIDQNIDEVEGFVTDEYIEWISDTKTLFNHLI